MSKGKIIISIVVLIITIPILFIYLSFTNSVDCSQLVIDTYEVHSSINIPEVAFINCYYDEQLNTRISVYELKGEMDFSRFKQVESSFEQHFRGAQLLSNDEHPKESAIYVASGEKWGTTWTYAIDQNSKRLWAELSY